MLKTCFTILLSAIIGFSGFSQKQKVSKSDKAALDSMMKNDEFLKMMKDKNSSSVDITLGLGNGAFSGHNRAVNATGVANQLIFTPALFYHHKSGFGIGATTYITNDSISSGVYQTGITGSYDYTGDKVAAGVAYTRFVSDMNKYNSKSIYQNDVFAYVKSAKGIIRPLLNIGYDNGNYKEVDLVKVYRPVLMDSVTVKDSTTNSTSYFALSAGIEHDFNLFNIFSKTDELDIVPSVLINGGSDKLTTTQVNKNYAKLAKILKNRNKRIVATNSKFQLMSISAALDCTYSIGKFSLQPSLYADYYLPSTTSKRLTIIYSLTAGLSF